MYYNSDDINPVIHIGADWSNVTGPNGVHKFSHDIELLEYSDIGGRLIYIAPTE